MNPDELAARLLTTFLGELDEQVGAMNADLLALEADPGAAERLKSLFRILHTVKGAARVAGVRLIEQACHLLETSLADIQEGGRQLDAERFQLLYAAADAFADLGQRIRAGRTLQDAPLMVLLRTLTAGPHAPMAAGGEVSPPADPEMPATPSDAAATEYAEGPIRVQPGELNELLALAGDLLITTGRVANRPGELEALHARLERIAAEWRRAGPRLRLALERAGASTKLVELVPTFDESLQAATRETGLLVQQTTRDARTMRRITGGVAESVHRLRLLPFADACQALPRAVRDVAQAAGRNVGLELHGQEVRVDRAVVDALREPLLHLVRNAVDHGIETPAERARAGKAEQGTVRVEAALRNGRLVVHVSDDGAGLDLAAIRLRLEERGLDIAPGEREIIRALFAGGLSTRDEVTAISGRGVGLDLVRATMERIGGSVDVAWTRGKGTTFVLESPPTPARIRALLVGVGTEVFAIPTAHVARLLRIMPEEIRYIEGRPVLTLADAPIPFHSLAAILGPPLATKLLADRIPVIVLHAGGHQLALAVDQLLTEQELVFRSLERGRSSLPHVSGGAILPTGAAALVLNPIGVVAAGLSQAQPLELVIETPAARLPARRRILVVDDSITTRTLEQSVLEAAGYDVMTAVDGAAAWQLLQEHAMDLVVADVEMPRLDGFGLCEAIRGSRRLHELPIILVTALETQEHRARGLEVGADAYLAKSSFDQETLLETIRQMLA